MAVKPPGSEGPRFTAVGSPFGPHPKNPRSADRLRQEDSPEQKAARAENDARTRIARAEQSVNKNNEELSERADRVRDEYRRQNEVESARSESAIIAEKNKGYERLRDLQRAQQAEINRVRREGEQDLAKISDYYRNKIHSTEGNGKERLSEIEQRQQSELTLINKERAGDIEGARLQHATQIRQKLDHAEETISQRNKGSRDQYERARAASEEATEHADAYFRERHESGLQRQNAALTQIESSTAQKLKQIRQDTASKLAAYSQRQKDPFYKLVDMDANLSDRGDAYVLTARIPEHEQAHVNASIKGNQVQISGYRRNEEKLELTPGHSRGTSSFQSFNESFPLTWPVEARLMTREFDGDMLIVTIPKKTGNTAAQEPKRDKVERVRAERPQFPANLPRIT